MQIAGLLSNKVELKSGAHWLINVSVRRALFRPVKHKAKYSRFVVSAAA